MYLLFIDLFASFHCPLHSNHLRSHFNAAVLLHLHFTEFLFIFQMIHLILCFNAENWQTNFRMSCILQYCIPSVLCNLFRAKEQKHLINFMLQLESIRQNVPKGFKCYNNHIILKLIQLCTFICQNVLRTQFHPLSLTLSLAYHAFQCLTISS